VDLAVLVVLQVLVAAAELAVLVVLQVLVAAADGQVLVAGVVYQEHLV
jgi:hypothetical protein